MKILFVTNEIPFPPNNGVRIVSHNAMRLMYEAGHELALAVLTEERDNLENRFDRISKYISKGFYCCLPKKNKLITLLSSILKNNLFFVERYQDDIFESKLLKLINEFRPDAIHFDIISMIQYQANIPTTINTIASINDSYALTLKNSIKNSNYSTFKHVYKKLQFKKVKKYEEEEYVKFDFVHVMTDIDSAYLKNLNSKIETYVIPNGADQTLFNISNNSISSINVIFVAKLVGENLINLEKFIECSWMPYVDGTPNVKLNVVGYLEGEALILKEKYSTIDSIKFHGYIENLVDAYSDASIAIVPINKNSGLINKAVEGMAAGLAVVGFEKTFLSIQDGKPSENFIAVENYKKMGEEIVNLINNTEYLEKVSKNARTFSIKNFSWDSRICDYENMYSGIKQNHD